MRQIRNVTICAAVLFGVIGWANAQQANAVPAPVIVTNTPGVIVANTPSVNVANTANVNVRNSVNVANGVNNPLFTKSSEELNSFQLSGNFTASPGVRFTPPPGKVIVIDFVGFEYVGATVPIFRVGCNLGDSSAVFNLATQGVTSEDLPGARIFDVNQAIKAFGSVCTVSTVRGFTGIVLYTVVGHYI
jgi:hypothetical protein